MSEEEKPQTKVDLDWMNNPEEALNETDEGWGGIEQSNTSQVNQEQTQDMLIGQYKVDKLIFDVLENSAYGPELMAHLRNMTVNQPAFVFGTQTVIGHGQMAVLSPEQQGMMREGQNSIYRYFVERIEAARKGPPTVNKKEN